MIKYRGGKSKEIKYFEDYMPSDYSRFIEPFVGGGAVFFYLEPSHAVINDLNDRLIQFYKGVKNNYSSDCSIVCCSSHCAKWSMERQFSTLISPTRVRRSPVRCAPLSKACPISLAKALI